MFEAFYGNPVIQRLAFERRWTISDKDKVPIDMTDLLASNGQVIHGALTKKEGHCPYVDLHTLMKNIPNAKNNAYWLDAKTDGILVLDIEPKCPKVISDRLLQLPALYGEYSMSGKGYHLILPLPNTYEDVFGCKTAVKEEHGYYEFLCNHYVTFTRNVLPANLVPNMGTMSYDDYVNIWNEMAENIKVDEKNIVLEIMSEEVDTEWTDYIQTILQSSECDYSKTPEDFEDDMSRFEYGCTSHYYHELIKILKSIKVEYEKDELIWEIYRATAEILPYREKHDTARNGMPWLLYLSASIVERDYENYKNAMSNDEKEDSEFSEEEEELFYKEDASEYNCEYNII